MLKEFQHILCPVEFEDASLAAIPLAKRIVQENGGVLHVVHVVSDRVDPLQVGGASKIYHDERLAQLRLDGISRAQLEGVRHVMLVRLGAPIDEVILKAEQELDIDLVVMATHGQTGVLHLLTGGVAERLVHESRCPVLTVSDKAVGPL